MITRACSLRGLFSIGRRVRNGWGFLARPAFVDGMAEETGEGGNNLLTHDSGPRPQLLLKETPRHVARQPMVRCSGLSGLGILSIPPIFFFFMPLFFHAAYSSSLHPHTPLPPLPNSIPLAQQLPNV